MKFIIIILIYCSILYSFEFQTNFGTVIIDDNIIENPFHGGFNRPKVQWVDWDGDSDDDLFLLDEDSCIKYYANNGCNNDNCNFDLINTSFQDLCNISWFYISDFDLDNALEIITQDPNNTENMLYFENIDNEFVPIDNVYESMGVLVESNSVMTPTFADIDDDDDLDFFTGNMVGTVSFYENVGMNNGIPLFSFITNFWQDIYIVGSSSNQRHGASAITFIDLDQDDDLDLTWGDYFNQSLYIVWNEGSATNPVMNIDNILNQYPQNNPVITAGQNMPSFSDVDNDGDKDLFITVLSGAYGFQLVNNFIFYEKEEDFSLNSQNFIESLDLLSDINPEFVDIDNDDDLDLFLGTDFDPTSFPWIGKIHMFENIGNDENQEPIWSQVSNNFINNTSGNNLSPKFVDIDFDSDYDLFVGNFNGTISYYENIGDANEYNFLYIHDLPDIDLSGYSSPELVDIDLDDDFDLIVGNMDGILHYYENIGTKYSYDFEYIPNNFYNIDVVSRSSPKAFDFDNDGDLDLFIGSAYNNVNFYENIGDMFYPSFIESNDYFFPHLGLNTSLDLFISSIKNGLIVGVSTGGIYFLSFDNYLEGDSNMDNIINIFDIVILIEHILYDYNLGTLVDVDMNNDNEINIIDIVFLVELILSRVEN